MISYALRHVDGGVEDGDVDVDDEVGVGDVVAVPPSLSPSFSAVAVMVRRRVPRQQPPEL